MNIETITLEDDELDFPVSSNHSSQNLDGVEEGKEAENLQPPPLEEEDDTQLLSQLWLFPINGVKCSGSYVLSP